MNLPFLALRAQGIIATIIAVNTHATGSRIRAVLGPTNTGKTHLAIERLCAHSSGAIGFPLRLLAREVYDRVRALKGERWVALITGEERIEPPQARWLLCTAEAMPRDGGGLAFVALDEAQLAADPERGHIFTDRLLHARGREETMLLGSATLEPVMRALVPEAEIIGRPRFSTLSHAGRTKLSRVPPRSAIVAFSAEQVYATAEMLRRLRGGAAVVMGAQSPETRNRQVELFQSGEVDYIVATDAIGMGLNLDVDHVAFAALSKFDGRRQRRLTPAEMAQIAGRAGRHQRDGTFGAVSIGPQARGIEFTPEEIQAIEQHRFAPLARLFWREAEPRFADLETLIGDLEARPDVPQLAPAPEAIDLAVLRRLAGDPVIAASVSGPARVRRFWDVCSLPDFRQQGAETHARFVARLWRDLKDGCLDTDYVAARVARLDRLDGDIDTLQARIASIRSWTYIAQRPDWIEAREEWAERARAIESRLSDALHQRLTERFVNRRTSVLMKSMAGPARLPRVALDGDGRVLVEGEAIGRLDGWRFVAGPAAGHADRKLLLAAAERHLPRLLADKALDLLGSGADGLELADGRIMRQGAVMAELIATKDPTRPRLGLSRELGVLDRAQRERIAAALAHWLEGELAPLAPLRRIEQASRDPAAGSEVRALLLRLVAGGGMTGRDSAALAHVPREKRPLLRRLGIVIGALDIFVPALLKPAPRRLLKAVGADRRPLRADMAAVIAGERQLPAGYRRAGKQAIRLDMAEKLLRAAHQRRTAAAGRHFTLDHSLAVSMGLGADNFICLMRDGGFRQAARRPLAESVSGPDAPELWGWRAPRGRAPDGRRKSGDMPAPGKGTGRSRQGAAGRPASPGRMPAAGNAFAVLLAGPPGR